MLEALAQIPDEAIPAELELEAWALGDVVLVAVPGELFASLGSRIEAASAGMTLILGYTNGYVGYLTDISAHESQTYEALASPFGPEAANESPTRPRRWWSGSWNSKSRRPPMLRSNDGSPCAVNSPLAAFSRRGRW